MSRQAVPSEAGRPLLGTVLRVATSRSQRRGRPLSGRPLSGTSPEVCVCRGVLDGQVCRHSVFVQAGGLIAVRQRLAPVSKARSQDLKESRDFFPWWGYPCEHWRLFFRANATKANPSCYLGQLLHWPMLLRSGPQYLNTLRHMVNFAKAKFWWVKGVGGASLRPFFFKPHFIMIIVFFFFETIRTGAMGVIHIPVKTEETRRLRIKFVLCCPICALDLKIKRANLCRK